MTLIRILFVITSCLSLVSGQGVNPLSITRVSPTQFQLAWYANTLRPYQIENSPDLMNWMELTGYIEGTNTQQGVVVNKTADKMFFRLKTGAVRTGFDSDTLPANDDDSVLVADDFGTPLDESIGFLINVFPTVQNPGPWNRLYINNNGNVSIGRSLKTWTPLPLQTSAQSLPGLVALIAPFWGDVDTRLALSLNESNGCKEVTFGKGIVDGRPAFGVNWINVGYFYYKVDKLNSFQLILIDRSNTGASGDFDAEFNYNQVLWEQGFSEAGNSGYGATPARVGITNGINRTIEAQYSGETIKQLDFIPSTGAKNDSTGLIYRKRDSTVPGRQLYQFRNGNLLDALQVNAGPDHPSSSSTSVATTPLATASDPSGGAIVVKWSILKTNSTIPVVISNDSQLNITITYSLGSTTDMLLVVRRVLDPTVSASDVMTIKPTP